jgi:hypothetical protein
MTTTATFELPRRISGNILAQKSNEDAIHCY